MNKISATAAALALAAVFSLVAAPTGAQQTPAPAKPAASLAEEKQQQYQALKKLLSQAREQIEKRRNEIARDIQVKSPNLTQTEINLRAERQLTSELARESAERRQKLDSDKKGTPHIDLPGAFYKAVRGCSTDGQIYRLTYNLTINFDELAAPPGPNTPDHQKSLLHRLVQTNPESVLGVSGTDRFIEALKAITGGVHNSMQIIAGRLMDESTGEFMQRPLFVEVMNMAASEITTDFKDRYGVTITVRADQPRRQAGKCEPAAPPKLLFQPQSPTQKP